MFSQFPTTLFANYVGVCFFNFNGICVQLNMLLNRLYVEPIGFTVLGIFIIDRNTILTVGVYRWFMRLGCNV